MLATRMIRSRRPADLGAGRLLAHGMFVIVLIIGAVLAHGGSCAAMEMTETAGQIGHAGVRAHDANSAVCAHRSLPPRHQHGTEQDCSATGPGVASAPLAPQAATAPSPVQTAGGPPPPLANGPLHPPGFPPESLCVMRI